MDTSYRGMALAWSILGILALSTGAITLFLNCFARVRNSILYSSLSFFLIPILMILFSAALVLMNGENFGTYNWQILTSIILFAGTFIASYRYKVNPILLIVICGIIGYVTFGYILTPQ
jgi:chromate transporter